MLVLMFVTVDVAYDGPELMYIESAAVNPISTSHMQDVADTSVAGVSGCHTRSLLVQQRKPGSCGDSDDDDDDAGDETVRPSDANVAAVRPGNCSVLFSDCYNLIDPN